MGDFRLSCLRSTLLLGVDDFPRFADESRMSGIISSRSTCPTAVFLPFAHRHKFPLAPSAFFRLYFWNHSGTP